MTRCDYEPGKFIPATENIDFEELAAAIDRGNAEFFDSWGVPEHVREKASKAWEHMVQVENRRGGGHFLQTPAARKAFIVGWFLSREMLAEECR